MKIRQKKLNLVCGGYTKTQYTGPKKIHLQKKKSYYFC